MFNSFFLFIILLAFMHTHLISALDVFPCITLHLLSSCTLLAFFDETPPLCPTGLNIALYPNHWQPPLTVPRQKGSPLSTQMHTISDVHVFSPHKAVPQIHVSHFLFLAKPLHHPVDCHPLRISVSLYPVTKHW